ncbi:hypothetical protein ACHAW6_000995 [Cyclotella cf. meneghiniana]
MGSFLCPSSWTSIANALDTSFSHNLTLTCNISHFNLMKRVKTASPSSLHLGSTSTPVYLWNSNHGSLVLNSSEPFLNIDWIMAS